jgi:DNA-binding phage protein
VNAARAHDETVVDLLNGDLEFAAVYFAAALDEVDQPGGRNALLAALRQIAEAGGMACLPSQGRFRRCAMQARPQ